MGYKVPVSDGNGWRKSWLDERQPFPPRPKHHEAGSNVSSLLRS